mmetsp:Transcript_6568/g.19492  ORF Transcript_6568/g.19492 Transcript_6568/m.19492 type:complete len:227 (-) Transcript_6568:359-1039(-)
MQAGRHCDQGRVKLGEKGENHRPLVAPEDESAGAGDHPGGGGGAERQRCGQGFRRRRPRPGRRPGRDGRRGERLGFGFLGGRGGAERRGARRQSVVPHRSKDLRGQWHRGQAEGGDGAVGQGQQQAGLLAVEIREPPQGARRDLGRVHKAFLAHGFPDQARGGNRQHQESGLLGRDDCRRWRQRRRRGPDPYPRAHVPPDDVELLVQRELDYLQEGNYRGGRVGRG